MVEGTFDVAVAVTRSRSPPEPAPAIVRQIDSNLDDVDFRIEIFGDVARSSVMMSGSGSPGASHNEAMAYPALGANSARSEQTAVGSLP